MASILALVGVVGERDFRIWLFLLLAACVESDAREKVLLELVTFGCDCDWDASTFFLFGLLNWLSNSPFYQ